MLNDYKIVTKKAKDVFKNKFNLGDTTKNSLSAALNFDVNVIEWEKPNDMVPIYDKDYIVGEDNLFHFMLGFQAKENQWLYGHTGTGKSTFVMQIASILGYPVFRVNLDSNIERPDLVGQIHLENYNGVTISKFKEGILPTAMQQPSILLLDEIDAGRPDILFVIQRALEGNGLMLTEDGGRVVKPDSNFHFIATANTKGQGDEFGMYMGVRTMNSSLLDRFSSFMSFEYMNKTLEENMLKNKFPNVDQKVIKAFVQFGNEVRTAFDNSEIYTTMSPRTLQTMVSKYEKTFELSNGSQKQAFIAATKTSIENRVSKSDLQRVVEIKNRVFKGLQEDVTINNAQPQQATGAVQ